MHVNKIAKSSRKFYLKLYGVSYSKQDYLFLDVKKENDNIRELHKQLYLGLLEEFLDMNYKFNPHMTIGRIRNKNIRIEALEKLLKMNIVIDTFVDDLVIVQIDEDENCKIEYRVKLGVST